MKITEGEHGYFNTENDYKFGKQITLDGLVLVPLRVGRWVGIAFDSYADGNPVYDEWGCSLCGEEHYGEDDTLPNYCPNCGAKMESEAQI